MARDVINHSISKGQFLLCIFGIFLFILAWRMPETDIRPFLTEIKNWIFFLFGAIMSSVMWNIILKQKEKDHKVEIDRISEEKTGLQKKLDKNKKIISSNDLSKGG